jgi:FKBP-type peptidyl-prolyl cis-trans isomerase SlyD
MGGKRRGRGPAFGSLQAGPGTVVSFSYELFDAEGERVEATEPGEEVEILLGSALASPALERLVEGLPVGGRREAVLDPDEAFGPRDPEAILEVDRHDLPEDVAPGDELEAERDADGEYVLLKVLEVHDDMVVLDANPPLAGQKVRLRIAVRAVRLATEAEVAQAASLFAASARPETGPLLPVDRLLRRGANRTARGGDEPLPPHPRPREGRVA